MHTSFEFDKLRAPDPAKWDYGEGFLSPLRLLRFGTPYPQIARGVWSSALVLSRAADAFSAALKPSSRFFFDFQLVLFPGFKAAFHLHDRIAGAGKLKTGIGRQM